MDACWWIDKDTNVSNQFGYIKPYYLYYCIINLREAIGHGETPGKFIALKKSGRDALEQFHYSTPEKIKIKKKCLKSDGCIQSSVESIVPVSG